MQFNLNKVENIIFDFGGVILDIEPQNTIDAFIELVGKQAMDEVLASGILEKIEKGLLAPEEFIQELKLLINKNFSNTQFYAAWNAILLEFHPMRIKAIQKLQNTHQLYLLSNTNQIHFNAFSQKLKDEYQLTFDDLFNKTYVSHEMGKIKPEKEIYEQVLYEQKLNPSKTLFIEDTKENAEAAEELGINTLVIPRNGMFFDYLKS